MKKIFNILFILLSFLALTGCTKISGSLQYSNNALDDEFQIEVDSPVLIRRVEMLQLTTNSNGEEVLAFSNKNIANDDDLSIENGVISKLFYNEISIDGHKLTENEIYKLVYNNEDLWICVDDLPTDNGNKYNLALYENSYASANNSWQKGDIRVTFYYLDPNLIYSIK